MKIIITEGGTANNIGSMALIENAIHIARHKYAGCEIAVFCNDAESVKKALKKDGFSNVDVYDDLFVVPDGGSAAKALWLTGCIFWIIYTRILNIFSKNISWALWGHRKKLIKEAEDADFIYCIGAERINDIYFKTALLSLYAIDTYLKMDKKLIHFSLTIGPVFYKSTIKKAKKVLNRSYAIFVRDQKSYDILNQWKCGAPYQFNTYDIALLQNKADESEMAKEYGIEKGFVGVSCIQWGFRKVEGPVRQLDYEKAIAETLDYIVEKYDRQIVFTPTVVNVGAKDDVEVGRSVTSLMKHKDRVVIIDRLLTPVEMASLFSIASFSIVTRMHAAILCSGAGGTPIIAINYLYKLREYMKNIHCEYLSIDIDYTNSKDLIKFVDRLMTDYDNIKQNLLKRQQKLKDWLTNDYLSI